jgi:hypothetical protein
MGSGDQTKSLKLGREMGSDHDERLTVKDIC